MSYNAFFVKLIGLAHNKLYFGIKGKWRASWPKYFGFSYEQFKAHIESKFSKGMSWENYGNWQIDHIIPIKYFVLYEPTELGFNKCWSLFNLQPLWIKDNNKKRDLIPCKDFRDNILSNPVPKGIKLVGGTTLFKNPGHMVIRNQQVIVDKDFFKE